MRLVTRYLLARFIGPLAACLIVFNGLYVLFDLFGHVSKFGGMSLLDIARYYSGLVSMYAAWFTPASCMLATLWTMWQLSHHSELTAMRASGIGFHKITAPFFATTLLVAAICFANAEFITPAASWWSDCVKDNGYKVEGAFNNAKEEHLFLNGDRTRSWEMHGVDIGSPRGFAAPSGEVIVRCEKNGVPYDGWRAKGAKFMDGVWWLENAKRMAFEMGEEIAPEAVTAKNDYVPSLLPMPEWTETPRDMFIEVRPWDYLSARDKLRWIQTHHSREAGRIFDFWFALISPWACVVITFFAIPAGINTGRQSIFKGVVFALGSFFLFYVLVLAFEYLGTRALVPPLVAALFPNAFFAVTGFMLYRKLT